MYITIDKIRVNYEVSGAGKNVLLLHGWGTSLQAFAPLQRYLKDKFKVFAIDFPGFGASEQPPIAWGTEEYTVLIKKFQTELGITNPILIGHSFGGRVAIRLAASEKVNKVVLIDSAGIRLPRSRKYYTKIFLFKVAKKVLAFNIVKKAFKFISGKNAIEYLQQRFGSADYKNASGVMRSTLVKVVNEDLKDLLPKIQAPTLLIWGENDQDTPVAAAKIMEKLIPDAGLVVLKNAGHYSYLDSFQQFLLVLNSFLNEDVN